MVSIAGSWAGETPGVPTFNGKFFSFPSASGHPRHPNELGKDLGLPSLTTRGQQTTIVGLASGEPAVTTGSVAQMALRRLTRCLRGSWFLEGEVWMKL